MDIDLFVDTARHHVSSPADIHVCILRSDIKKVVMFTYSSFTDLKQIFAENTKIRGNRDENRVTQRTESE